MSGLRRLFQFGVSSLQRTVQILVVPAIEFSLLCNLEGGSLMRSRITFVALFAAVCLFQGVDSCHAYRLSQRWTSTATNGGGLVQGQPTTITYSFLPDGTNIAGESQNSDLIAFLDNEFGSSATWLPLFQQSFDRWDELSGLTTIYEPNDDGVTANGNNSGVLGVRGDVRMGGVFIDGPSNVLAYNYFPNRGDMVLDTADGNFYDTPNNNFRALRNVIMHEHGHGLGFSHVESSNSRNLMEPFIDTSFDGPQFDDLLAVQRGYGDIYEENGGNDSIANATSLGSVAGGSTVSIGTHASNTTVVIPSVWTDFVSVDDNSDLDYYSFTVDGPSSLDIALDPRGPTYNEGPQGGSQSTYATRSFSNLTLNLYDTNGALLTSENSTGAGSAETISGFNVGSAGTYYVRASGNANEVQMYRLDISATDVALPGDFSGNNDYDCADLDALVAAVAGGSTAAQWDLNSDNNVDVGDVSSWLSIAGAAENASGNPYLPGDANLDGVVNGADYVVWSSNRFTATPAWCSGDFNADGFVNGADYVIWSSFRFQSSDSTNAVPEPGHAALLFVAAACYAAAKRR
jgi:hypothetical protein